MPTEIWRYGAITEDKKLPVRFLDSNNIPIPIAALVGYGVELYIDGRSMVKAGVNITGFSDANIEVVDENTVQIILPGANLPKITGKVTAVTTIVMADDDMPEGIFTDHSESVVHIYNTARKND
jgi:hypothetical protein